MKLRPLILNPAVRQYIKKVLDYAELNRRSLHRQFNELRAGGNPISDNPHHSCLVPIGFCCTFSFDELPAKSGEDQGIWIRHLSISLLHESNVMPNIYATGELMKEFGFKTEFPAPAEKLMASKLMTYSETREDRQIIHVCEPI